VRRLEEDLNKDDVGRRFYSTGTANSLTRKLLKTLDTSK